MALRRLPYVKRANVVKCLVFVCTYCVNLVVFVLSVDVFDICYDVCVQCLWKEKRECLLLNARREKTKEHMRK